MRRARTDRRSRARSQPGNAGPGGGRSAVTFESPTVIGSAVLGAALAVAFALAFAAPAAAGAAEPLPPPDLAGIVLGWSFDATVWLPLLATALAYAWAVRRVDTAHPANRVPRDRLPAFMLGLATIAVALQSGIARWDDTLFSIHMVQHLLLVFVAAPLIAMGAPITVALRAASPSVRNRYLLPLLHSRAVRVLAHPIVAWLIFAAAMWGSHVSPLFDLALRVGWVHDLEHALYLAASLLFWWPIVGRDPAPWRLAYPARLLYLFTQMPLNSFLGVVILFSGRVLYPAYEATGRTWGPSPLDDQQLAGAIMWGAGDAAFLLALLIVIAMWMRSEEAITRRREAVLDAHPRGAGGEPGGPPPLARLDRG